MEDPVSQIITQLFIVVILTGGNAFFAATEISAVSVNKTKIKKLATEGNKKAQRLLTLTEDATKLLSTIQVAITLSGFFSSGLAATGLSPYLGAFFISIGLPQGNTIAFFVITIILSYITLVFGELVPKRIAMQKAESVALATSGIIFIVAKVAAPFIKLLAFSTKIILNLLGMQTEGIEEEVSKEEIAMMIESGGILNKTEKNMIDGVFTFDDKLAKEVMTPRTEIYAIDIEDTLDEVIPEMLDNMYSRIPVYEEDIDNIIGVLYMKDFIEAAYQVGFAKVKIREIMKVPYFVPERKNIDILFREMQAAKKHIAILVDEYGGVSGLVTIEDLIEEILGEIEDEFDDEEPEIIKVSDDVYQLKGILHIVDLNEALDTDDFDADSEEYDSVGGLIIDILGHIPDEIGEEIRYKNYVFLIKSLRENHVEQVLMTILPQEFKEENNTVKIDNQPDDE